MTRLNCSVCLLALLAGTMWADEPPPRVILSGESRNAAGLIADARKSLADKKWPEAILQLQTLIEKGADELVPLNPRQTVQARRAAHLLLATLPPEALAQYRNRVDGPNLALLKQGLEQRDPHLLQQVVEGAFCSRPAEKALDALGDLAFERGDFDEAESWWRLLLPAGPLATVELHFPQPTLDPARLRAKFLLARLFRDGPKAVAPDLAGFGAEFGKAEGSLAGRTGKYIDILHGLTEPPRTPNPELPSLMPEAHWTTFGGSPARGLVVPVPANITDRLGQLCQQPRFWVNLEDRKRIDRPLSFHAVATPATRTARALAFHPVIAAGKVLFADARHVTACDLRTGECVTWYDAARDNGGIKPDLSLPASPDLRYTLTVADDCVFARLGEQVIQNSDDGQPRPNQRPRDKPESLLVCLSFQPGADGDRLRWQARPGVANDNAVFEGAPLAHGGQVYIAATRFVQGQAVTAIHCYAGNSGALRWRKDVCETSAQFEDKRYRHHLLTAAGPNVVYCSHRGAIVALEAVTGRRAWGVRYPHRSAPTRPDAPPALTDLCPCLYADGRVYAAPADSDRLLCLDAGSGRIVWGEDAPYSVVHLLGLVRKDEGGRRKDEKERLPSSFLLPPSSFLSEKLLIFTTPTGLQAVNAATGSTEGGWSIQSHNRDLMPMGRGLLLGDVILWPTARGEEVHLIRQADGKIADNPTLVRNVRAGNLAYGEGCLVTADRFQMTVFVPPAWCLQERQEQSRRQPEAIGPLLELARCQADANSFHDALATLDRAASRTDGGGRMKDERSSLILPLSSFILSERHGVLLRQAAQLLGDEADHVLQQAAAENFPPRLRLVAMKRRMELARQREQAGREAEVWQGILGEPALRGLTWDGVQPAAIVARDHLARLRSTHGASLFADHENAAQAALRDSKSLPVAERREKLEELAEAYAGTTAARTALRTLGREYTELGRPGAAACAYRQLLAYSENSATEGADLQAALAACQLLLREKDPPGALLPLGRSWNRALMPGEVFLKEEGGRRKDEGRTFILHPSSFLLSEVQAGEVCWRSKLAFVPDWTACQDERVIAAGRDGLACIRGEDGRCLWQISFSEGSLRKDEGGRMKDEEDVLPSSFLRGNRIYVMHGRRRFLVYDAETGRLAWSQWAPAGALGTAAEEARFHPEFRVMDRTVLLQTAGGRRWLLDAGTGRLIQDVPTDHYPWPRVFGEGKGAPARGEHSLPCLVCERGRVVRLDPAGGSEIWNWALPPEVQRTGEPVQLRVTPAGILVLTPVNRGQHLQLLDPAAGKPLWDREVILTTSVMDLSAWSVDSKAIFLVREGTLLALNLENGKVLWEQALAGLPRRGRTKLIPGRRGGDALLVYPDGIAARMWKISWLFGSLQWIVGDALAGQGCSIHCCDPVTGQLVQRLNLPLDRPPFTLSHGLSDLTAVPRLRMRQMRLPNLFSLHVDSLGLTVAVGGQLWGYRPMVPERRPMD